MAGLEWEELANKVREEMARRYQEGLYRPQGLFSVWPPLTTAAYDEARHLKKILLRECAGKKEGILSPTSVLP